MPRGNYILRHWRGANSLAWAFWVNGIVVNLIVALLSFAIADTGTSLMAVFYDPHIALPVVIVALIVLTGVLVWQVIGIWRSAYLHKSRGGSRLWAALASLVAVFWCISSTKEFLDVGVPAVEMLYNYVRNPGTDQRSVSVLAGGREIELAGLISLGATSDVREALDKTGAGILRLNSGGGRLGEAVKLLMLVRERNLVTYSSTGCNSSCTIPFLGGEERWLSTMARLGFHRFSGIPEGSGLESMAEDQVRTVYEDLGLPAAFIERVLATPTDDLWYPTIDELLAANLITGVAQPAQFADETDKAEKLSNTTAPF